ncbi:MAG: DUF72 domain-containing protein, partial [Acidobacteriaceae bacterium]
QEAALFPGDGSHLERYAHVFACVEINSSFYRPQRPSTYAKWASATPEYFRFSVKAPKAITHGSALAPASEELARFLDEVRHLGGKLGPILFQFPPRQQFEPVRAWEFFSCFRDLYPSGKAAVEPRHADWFRAEADSLLKEFQLARVAADPPPAPEPVHPAGYAGLVYSRLHGSPRTYYSSYPQEWIEHHGEVLLGCQEAAEVWCIFDNTASGAAIGNARALARYLKHRELPR